MICTALVALPKSPMNLAQGDEVPQIITRRTRQRPSEFLTPPAKRLLQHNPPETGRRAFYEYTLDLLSRSGPLTALAVFEQLVKGDTPLRGRDHWDTRTARRLSSAGGITSSSIVFIRSCHAIAQ